jgi:hypothetical protein
VFGIAAPRALGEEGPAVAFTAVHRVVPALGSADSRGGEGWERPRVSPPVVAARVAQGLGDTGAHDHFQKHILTII